MVAWWMLLHLWIFLVNWWVVLLVTVGCFVICFKIINRLWKVYNSYGLDLLVRKHGCLLDTLCFYWCLVCEHSAMYMNSDLFLLWNPLPVWCYSASFGNNNFYITTYIIGISLYFSCMTTWHLFPIASNKKPDLHLFLLFISVF